MKRFNQAVLALSLALAVPALAEVKVNSPTDTARAKPHVGLLLGYGDINGSPKGAFNYGVDTGFQICTPWSLGFQINTLKADTDVDGISIRRWSILPKVTYNFGGTTPIIKSSYAGLKLGAVIDRYEFGGNGDSTTRFGLAPVIGFDEPVAEDWTAGLELSYLFVVGPEKNNDSLHVLGAIKYWF